MPVLDVLLVEDNGGDVKLIREAFVVAFPDVHIHLVDDGRDAIAYLVKARDTTLVPTPHIILCDINMPRMSGLDVLRTIRKHEAWKSIPVVMMSSSANPEIIEECKRLGVKAYLAKPNEFDGYLALCHRLRDILQTASDRSRVQQLGDTAR